MSRAYADIAFTAAVRACQTKMGSRHAYEALDRSPDRRDTLTAQEADFIHARDGFYQASVSETGWPYVQYRGGPPGFLQVLDGKTMAYADFRGNRQYISTGNLIGNDRIALFLMDYANQRRLKIMGRVCQVSEDEALRLLPRLQQPSYPAPVERVVKIGVEAYDWNCPKHITPRFTESEIDAAVAPLHAEIARLQLALKKAESPRS
jgi:predicted pyridoxine 5'-phosphate oxidase superfamily flavin-nucleotide-binding protein